MTGRPFATLVTVGPTVAECEVELSVLCFLGSKDERWPELGSTAGLVLLDGGSAS